MQWVLDGDEGMVRPMMEGNPEQFGGVLAMWKERESLRVVLSRSGRALQ